MTTVEFDASDFQLLLGALQSELVNIRRHLSAAASYSDEGRAYWDGEKARVEKLIAKILAAYR